MHAISVLLNPCALFFFLVPKCHHPLKLPFMSFVWLQLEQGQPLPSPQELLGKILIKNKKKHHHHRPSNGGSIRRREQEEQSSPNHGECWDMHAGCRWGCVPAPCIDLTLYWVLSKLVLSNVRFWISRAVTAVQLVVTDAASLPEIDKTMISV